MAARLIVNPAAGHGRARAILEALRGRLETEAIEVCITEGPGHATELSRAVADRTDFTVISLGGDGTHHEVVNGLMPSPMCTLGLIPAGTGNDFARICHLPSTPEALLDVALRGPTMSIDVGHVADRYFLTVAGVGFDAEVAGWANQHAGAKKRKGAAIFIQGVFANLWRFHPAALTVTRDEHQETRPTFLLAAGNTAEYAGGMRICPGALADDGRLSVVWIGPIAPLAVLPLLAKVFSGNHVTHPQVDTFDCQELFIEGPDTLWVHADGELVGHPPVRIRLVPGALRVRHG